MTDSLKEETYCQVAGSSKAYLLHQRKKTRLLIRGVGCRYILVPNTTRPAVLHGEL